MGFAGRRVSRCALLGKIICRVTSVIDSVQTAPRLGLVLAATLVQVAAANPSSVAVSDATTLIAAIQKPSPEATYPQATFIGPFTRAAATDTLHVGASADEAPQTLVSGSGGGAQITLNGEALVHSTGSDHYALHGVCRTSDNRLRVVIEESHNGTAAVPVITAWAFDLTPAEQAAYLSNSPVARLAPDHVGGASGLFVCKAEETPLPMAWMEKLPDSGDLIAHGTILDALPKPTVFSPCGCGWSGADQ